MRQNLWAALLLGACACCALPENCIIDTICTSLSCSTRRMMYGPLHFLVRWPRYTQHSPNNEGFHRAECTHTPLSGPHVKNEL